MAQHLDPSFRPGRGQTREVRYLNKEAQAAHSLWVAMYADRYCEAYPDLDPDYKSRVHYDKIDATLAEKSGTLLGELLRIAVEDARTRALPNPRAQIADSDNFHVISWKMANYLADEQERMTPPPVLDYDRSTHCRHGRPYFDECADCDSDF